MYAKVFMQIYDGTLCTRGPWQALVTFQQFLVLADQDGIVDMTAAAISRRTTIPIEIIEAGIEVLMQPDPESRTPTLDGRRLVYLAESRSWGWQVVNYKHYRELKREEDRREYHRQYYRDNRSKAASTVSTDTQQSQPIQPKQKQKQKQKQDTDSKTKTARKRASPAALVPVDVLVEAGFDEDAAAEFISHKSAVKAPLTDRAWADHIAESRKAGWHPMQAAIKVMAKNWRGFEAKYVASEARPDWHDKKAAEAAKWIRGTSLDRSTQQAIIDDAPIAIR